MTASGNSERDRSPWANRRVLITGASGFIGRFLVERLVEAGAEVHGIARSSSRLPPGIRGWAVDLRHADALRAVVESVRPEIVFHLAAFVTARQDRGLVRPMLEHTLVSTVHLLNSLADVSCERVVLTSSAEVPVNLHVAPTSPYAAAKGCAALFAAMFQRLYGLSTVTLRPTLVYGPGQPQDKLLPYIIGALRRGSDPALASADRLCDLLFVRDLVDALCQAALQPGIEGLTIDVGSSEQLTLGNLVQRLAGILGKTVDCHSTSQRRIHEADLVVDTEPAARLLSWRARWKLEDGLRATVNAYAPAMERRNVA